MKTHKTIILFFISYFILSIPPTHGHFECIIQNDLRREWLPLLADPALDNRFKAIQAFFAFPQWALPIVRKAITNHSKSFKSNEISKELANKPLIKEKIKKVKERELETT